MELSSLSLAELKDLLTLIPAEIKKREKDEKARILKELEALATQRGFSLDELLADAPAKAKKPKGVVAVKYRHPENGQIGWTGRGRKPKWVVDFLANGGALEQLAV